LNPAVTVGFVAARRFLVGQLVPYVVSQCLGAVLATGLLRVLFPAHSTLGATAPAGPALQSFVLEVVLTFLLMFVILSVSAGSKEKGDLAGIAVGSVVGLGALFAAPIAAVGRTRDCPDCGVGGVPEQEGPLARLSPVHHHFGPRQVRRLVGGQEEDRAGDLLGRVALVRQGRARHRRERLLDAPVLENQPAEELLLLPQRGLHAAGGEHVDAEPLRARRGRG